MTKSEFTALVNAYGAENVVSIVFDNSLVVNFLDSDRFSLSCVKTVGGVDIIELKNSNIRSKKTGCYDIECTTVHPLDMVQCIGFSPAKDRADIDKQTFHNR